MTTRHLEGENTMLDPIFGIINGLLAQIFDMINAILAMFNLDPIDPPVLGA